MYVPAHAREDRPAILQAAVNDIGFGTLITVNAEQPVLTHLPMMLVDGGINGIVVGHIARANGQWKAPAAPAVAAFVGPSFYVSPSYYATKALTGKVVPTYHYIAVEARGTIVFYHEPERLLQLVRTLTERHEAEQRVPWKVADAPADFIDGKLRAIVGFELHVEELTGAWKFAQNKNDADRGGVADALATSEVAALRDLSGVVRRGVVG